MFAPLKPDKNSNTKNQGMYPITLRHAINKKGYVWVFKRSYPTTALLSTAFHAAELAWRSLLHDYEIE
jgi:hypothetical protein